jgi:DNA-binding NtrC family response regulator
MDDVSRKMTRLGALRVADPRRWEMEVRAAIRREGGNLTHAAAKLGISWRQLVRWARELGIDGQGKGGRPAKAKSA